MKKLMLWMVALAEMTGGAVSAQDITGARQGTLQTPQRDLRVVVKVSRGWAARPPSRGRL